MTDTQPTDPATVDATDEALAREIVACLLKGGTINDIKPMVCRHRLAERVQLHADLDKAAPVGEWVAAKRLPNGDWLFDQMPGGEA